MSFHLFRSRVVLTLSASAMALAGWLGTGSLSAQAVTSTSPVSVWVGYADDVRPNPTQFPTPWQGDPGVNFQGCTPIAQCAYDAGAVRVVNTSSAAVTIDKVIIKFGSSCTYDIWPHNLSLAAAGQLIVTQTTSGADNGCSPQNGHMDSSDIGPNGQGWAFNCTDSGIVPEVDVSVNGTLTAYTDTGKVLNTGGVDLAACDVPGRKAGNESTPWTPIGKGVCFGVNTLTLAPLTQTQDLGKQATVTATLSNSCGGDLSGAVIHFTVTAGPDVDKTGTATTDQSGKATFSYTNNTGTTGNDTVSSSVSNPAGTVTSNPVTVTWKKPTPVLQLTPASQTASVGNSVTISATLTNATPENGHTVTFTVTGPNARTGTATTDANGKATFTYSGTNTGSDSVSAATTANDQAATSNSATVTWTPKVLPATGGGPPPAQPYGLLLLALPLLAAAALRLARRRGPSHESSAGKGASE